MKKPANPGGKNRSRLARGFRKIVSIFSSKSEFNTNTSFSTAKAGGTKVVKGSEIRPAKTDTVLETFSHSDNASTGLKENSSTAVDPSITTPSNPIGPFHDTAAITSGPGSDMPGSSFSVINCTPDTTELANAVGNAPSANNPQSTRSELSAAPTTLPFDNASPAVTAIPTGAAVPAFDTIPGSDKSILNADGTLIIPQIAVAETANGPVTAPGVNPASINERTAQPQLWLQAKHAPIWNEALQILKEEESGMYKELEKTKSSLLDSRERKTDEFFKLDTAKPEEKAIVQRWKQYLPSLAAIRGIAMRAAVFEPHGVAPIVCACVFFSIDLFFNALSPEAKSKMRNILFKSVVAINEWISFESNFQKKSHNAIQHQVKELEGLLIDQYLQALRLLCDILLSCNGSWTKGAGDKLTNKILAYEDRLAKLKDHKSMWASKKKLMEERLASEKGIAEVLEWIKKKDDPEEPLRKIGSKVTSEGRYPNCAQWILRSNEFQNWSRRWFPQEEKGLAKRMIWVSGPYGTGKTTIIYRVVSELLGLSETFLRREQSETPGDEGQPDRPLRVIPYFCTALSGEQKRADYSTIIRALARKISLMPDFTLAQRAETFYTEHTRGLQERVETPLWKEFLRELLRDDKGVSDFVFVIDALDECDSAEEPEDSGKLLDFMRELMREFDNIQILCSSRQHVPIKNYFSDEVLYHVDPLSGPPEEIQNFIRDEIDSREDKQRDSVFSNKVKAGCEDLRERLKQSLIDHAEGMYEWVQIWLKLTIPIHNNRGTIRLRENAEELLKAIEDSSREPNNAYEKLKDGYMRLWKLGALTGFNEIRVRLFRLILCSFRPLDIVDLIFSLRIRVGSNKLYERLSFEEIEGLYLNFMIADYNPSGITAQTTLRFTHDSAREFVMREILGKTSEDFDASLVMKENHRSFAKLFVEIMQRSDHPYWAEEIEARKRSDYPTSYIEKYGLKHCRHAAKKQSIFDEVWNDMIQRVLIPPESEFMNRRNTIDLENDTYTLCTIGSLQKMTDGSHLLLSHALVRLDIIHDDDVPDLQPKDYSTAPSDADTPRDILRHFAEHALMKNDSSENALQLACSRGNATAAKLVLEITYNVLGKDACTDLLSAQSSYSLTELEYRLKDQGLTPFARAVLLTGLDRISMQRLFGTSNVSFIPVMETLLRFESQHLNAAGKVQQWLHDMYLLGEKALAYAMRNFEEDTLCRLLKISEPIAINEPDSSGNTPLCLAAKKGRLKIMRILVEDYHADINIKIKGETALDIARIHKIEEEKALNIARIIKIKEKTAFDIARSHDQQAAIDYLESRMNIPEPVQSADLSSDGC